MGQLPSATAQEGATVLQGAAKLPNSFVPLYKQEKTRYSVDGLPALEWRLTCSRCHKHRCFLATCFVLCSEKEGLHKCRPCTREGAEGLKWVLAKAPFSSEERTEQHMHNQASSEHTKVKGKGKQKDKGKGKLKSPQVQGRRQEEEAEVQARPLPAAVCPSSAPAPLSPGQGPWGQMQQGAVAPGTPPVGPSLETRSFRLVQRLQMSGWQLARSTTTGRLFWAMGAASTYETPPEILVVLQEMLMLKTTSFASPGAQASSSSHSSAHPARPR